MTSCRQLGAEALQALLEFTQEKAGSANAFEELKAQIEGDPDDQKPLSMKAFSEDWNSSQFWYTDATAITLARSLLDGATKETKIAVISAPSVFLQLKNLMATKPESSRPKVCLLEFDDRFAVFPEFVRYDFQHPLQLPEQLKGSADRILLDPPFLSEDCQAAFAQTVSWLAKPAVDLRLVVCTGERMERHVLDFYSAYGTKTTDFEVEHDKGRLGNEFRCYANFQTNAWKYTTL